MWRYFVACLIREWSQRTTRRQYLLLLLNVEFKLRQYFAACLIREWRSNKNMALLRYTRSIRHAPIRRLLMHMHSITKMIAAYRASSLIKSWRANNIWHAACSSVYAPYNPRMAYIRSTLREILDFQKLHGIINCRMRNIVRSWHQAMLDATYGDFEYEAWVSHWTRYGLSTYLDVYIRVTWHKILRLYMLNCVTA